MVSMVSVVSYYVVGENDNGDNGDGEYGDERMATVLQCGLPSLSGGSARPSGALPSWVRPWARPTAPGS